MLAVLKSLVRGIYKWISDKIIVIVVSMTVLIGILVSCIYLNTKYYNYLRITSDGIFTMSPSGSLPAFHYEGIYNRTYIGYYTSDAKVKVVYYDEEKQEISEPVTLWSDWGNGDDHAGPSVLVLQHQNGDNSKHNGKILISSSAIFIDQPAQIRRSKNAENISEWEESLTFDTDVEYPTLIELKDGKVFLFYAKREYPNHGDRSQVYRVSIDAGETWSEKKLLFDADGSRRIYAIYYTNPSQDEIHAMFNLCPRHEEFGSWYKDIYYAYLGSDTYTWRKSDNIEYSLPITPRTGDLVYETDMTEGEEDHTWLSDIKVDRNNNPFLISINFKDYGSLGHNPGNNPGWEGVVQRHNFENGEWNTEIISENGASQFGSYSYPAMAVLDEGNLDIVYLTPYDGESSVLQKWKKENGTWIKIENIMKKRNGYVFRPTFVRNANKLKVLWCYTERYEHHRGGRWESMIFGYPK